MIGSLALCALALRVGVRLRRARLARRPAPRGARARHLRLAKPAVALVLVGFTLGPLSAFWLRGLTPFSTLHGVFGALAAGAFGVAAWQGRRLERGQASARQAHALCAALGLLAAATAAVAGFVLLP